MFILDTLEGFTHPGVEQLKDSVRTYVCAIMGTQVQARTDILGDAHKQEEGINLLWLLTSHQQSNATKMSCRLQGTFDLGPYMPSNNMELHTGIVHGYNKTVVATQKKVFYSHQSGLVHYASCLDQTVC